MPLLSSGIGIDVSDHHIRIAYVNHSGIPVGLYELVLSPGYIVDDKIEKPKELKEQIKKLLVKSGISDISADTTILVPESRVFSTSFVMSADKISKEEKKAKMIEKGQEDIPMPFKDAFIAFRDGAKVSEGVRGTVLAVQKDILNSLQTVFAGEQFPLVAVESNNKAVDRLYANFGLPEFLITEDTQMLMIVDIGHRWTNITVYDITGATVFSRSIAVRKLTDKSGGKLKLITKDVLIKICGAIKEAHKFFSESGYSIPFIIIAGVEGGQPNVAELCDKSIKSSKVIRMGSVVSIPNISEKELQIYGSAIGAALRSVKQHKYRKDHNFI